MKQGAKFSTCRTYRYALWRIWDEGKHFAMFCGLNPSTADEKDNDQTVTRCQQYAKNWGYGGLYMTNLFAYCSTDPANLYRVSEPIGSENDYWLKYLSAKAGIVVVVWGNDGAYLKRSNLVLQYFHNPHCLKINKTGEPHHPLGLVGSLRPIPFKIAYPRNAL